MNTNIKNIVIAVNKLYRFLYLPIYLDLLQPSELSYSMINMDNIITGIKSGKFLNRNAFLLCKITP